MYYADQIGLGAIVESLEAIAREQGNPSLEPAQLLRDLAANARSFQSLSPPIAIDEHN